MPKGIYKRTKETRKNISIAMKGKIISLETRRKISEALKGNTHGFKKGNHYKTEFKKGNHPKTEFKKGHKFVDEKNGSWKGDDVGITALHDWIRSKLGRPTKCEHCGKDGLTGHQIHWANKDHTYKRNLTDWIRLCASCHYKYDKQNN